MEKLDIKTLIEKAEELVYDGKLNGAAKAKVPVQNISIGEFQNFKLSIIAERDSHHEEPTNEGYLNDLDEIFDVFIENDTKTDGLEHVGKGIVHKLKQRI